MNNALGSSLILTSEGIHGLSLLHVYAGAFFEYPRASTPDLISQCRTNITSDLDGLRPPR